LRLRVLVAPVAAAEAVAMSSACIAANVSALSADISRYGGGSTGGDGGEKKNILERK